MTLLGLVPYWRLVAAGLGLVAVLAAVVYVQILRLQVAELQADNGELRTAAAINSRAMAQMERQHERTLASVQAEAEAARRRAAQLDTVRREVYRAPETDACARSPAVRAALDGLQRLQAAGGGRGGDAGGARQPLNLRSGAANPGRAD